MNYFKCKECDNVEEVASISIRVIDGKVVRTGDVCPACGGETDLQNPKKGMPALHGFGRFGISK